MGDHYNIEDLLSGFYNDKKVLIRESKKEIKTNTPSIISLHVADVPCFCGTQTSDGLSLIQVSF